MIVVSGDVAFAGDPVEFAYATNRLSTFCDAGNGALDSVFVGPGKHDVLREPVGRNLIQMIHRDIKTADDISEAIAREIVELDQQSYRT